MAVNLIDNEEIHVNQDGNDITLDIQADALKNDSVVVGSISSKNMLNINSFINGYRFGSDGGLFADSSYSASSYIEVKPNTDYIYSRPASSGSQCICYYGNDRTFISRTMFSGNRPISITTPNNAYYVRIAELTTDLNSNLQLELGDTATQYFPYQNLNGEENYSTGEIKIGTWINGKPLYRKVITRTVNANTNDNVSLSTLGITNQDTIIINTGLSTAHYQISTVGGGYAPIVYFVSNTDRAHVYVNANKELQIQNQNNNQREYNIVLEYTKTTD